MTREEAKDRWRVQNNAVGDSMFSVNRQPGRSVDATGCDDVMGDGEGDTTIHTSQNAATRTAEAHTNPESARRGPQEAHTDPRLDTTIDNGREPGEDRGGPHNSRLPRRGPRRPTRIRGHSAPQANKPPAQRQRERCS